MPAARTSAVIGRRMCAVLAAGSAALHAILLGHAGNPAIAALMAVMIAGCLYCAYDLWVRGTLRAWVIVALMNLAMVALHLPPPAHQHGATPAAAGERSTVLGLATVLAVVEVVLATAVLCYRTRGRTVSGKPAR